MEINYRDVTVTEKEQAVWSQLEVLAKEKQTKEVERDERDGQIGDNYEDEIYDRTNYLALNALKLANFFKLP